MAKSTALTTLDELSTQEHVSETTKARYAAQKAEGIVNPIVLANLLDVRPQMIYNYIRKGKFTASHDENGNPINEHVFGTNNTQKKVIALDEANTFAQGYLDRKVAREEKKAAQIEAELRGETVEAEAETV